MSQLVTLVLSWRSRAQRIQRRRGGGKANIALARKFLGVIHHALKTDWVFEDFPHFVLAS